MDLELIGKTKEFSFTWVIENFSFCWQKNRERISSPAFIVDTMAKTKWTLEIWPRGDEDIDLNFISFYLVREKDSKGPRSFRILFELSFLAVDGSSLASMSSQYSFTKDDSWGSSEFVKRDEVFQIKRKDFLPRDVLTARCRIWNCIGKVTKEGLCLARTQIGVERRSFMWNITQFSSFRISMHEITSVSEGNSLLTLKLFLCGGQTDKTPIRFEVCANDERVKFSTFRLHFVDTFGNRKECLCEEFTFDDDSETALFTLSFSREKLLESENLYLLNDILKLYCECAFATGIVSEEVERMSYGCPLLIQEGNLTSDDFGPKTTSLDSSEILKENLETSFKENLLCDTKLKTKTGTFPAHKYILSARSPVFKAMFTNDTKERNSEHVYIADWSDDTVRRMLLYMYTATVQDLQWKSASNLYAAAYMYEILSLKNKCSSFLKDNLCPDNACNLLILADMHHDQDLKSVVQDYILNHREIFNTTQWKLFMKTNVHLAADLMYLKLKD